jgi:hypothetical protein
VKAVTSHGDNSHKFTLADRTGTKTGLPDGYRPKIPIWVYLGGFWKVPTMLLYIYSGRLEYFTAIGYTYVHLVIL